MKWTPRPDQEQVMAFINTMQRACVFSPGGSGKTAMAATWLDAKMNDEFSVSRALIVAPKLVAHDGWPKELRRWDHLELLARPCDLRVLAAQDFGLCAGVAVTPLDNPKAKPKVKPKKTTAASEDLDIRNAGHTFADKRATKKHLLSLTERLHIVSWDFWPWLAKAYGVNFPYQAIIFDESSFLRDQESERNRAARWAMKSGVVTHMLQLTASPGANHEVALYGQMDLVEEGMLGRTLTEFREQWCVPDKQDWQSGRVYSWKIAQALRPAFHAKVGEVSVSVPSTLSVPLLYVEHSVELPEQARTAYDTMAKAFVWDGIAAGSQAVVASKLRQMAAGFVYDKERVVWLHDAKMEKMAEVVASIDAPVLVAYEFEEQLAQLKRAFGKKIQDIREKGAKQAFLDGKLRMLAVHPMSAGHGVDGLQFVCCNVIWPAPTWDEELFQQLNWRIHRHGTTAPTVYCHVILAEDTVELQIYNETLPKKRARQDELLQAVRVAPTIAA